MTPQELRDKVYEVRYTSEMNQLYHQRTAHKWWLWDKAVKIVVCLLAVFALVAAITADFGEFYRATEIGLAALAAIAAVILNVIPVGEWEAHSSELFRAWSDLRTCAELLEVKLQDYPDDRDVESWLIDRYSELLSKQHQLNAEESAANRTLLLRCQEDVNQRLFGPEKRTYASHVEEWRAKEQQQSTKPSSGVSAGAG